jgi:Ankyrin repeats (3 copies)
VRFFLSKPSLFWPPFGDPSLTFKTSPFRILGLLLKLLKQRDGDMTATALNRGLRAKPHGNATKKFKITPLMVAVACGSRECVDLLLRYGASPDVPECEADLEGEKVSGRTALHIALERGDRAIAKALIASGANVSLPYFIRTGREQKRVEISCLKIAARNPGALKLVKAVLAVEATETGSKEAKEAKETKETNETKGDGASSAKPEGDSKTEEAAKETAAEVGSADGADDASAKKQEPDEGKQSEQGDSVPGTAASPADAKLVQSSASLKDELDLG